MRKLIVRNLGPIKEVELDLKKVNVLIGEQGTGKSILAKIACYCSWVEKEICLDQSADKFSKDGYFIDNLTKFHKLSGFVNTDSFISFRSDVLSFIYENEKFIFKWDKNNRFSYLRRKTLYIPAERNIVAVIPNWFEVNLENNNTRSFLADWERVRKKFLQDTPLDLLNLGKYYFNPNDKTDHVVMEGKDVLLSNASSGLQTLVPLQALLKYYGDIFYSENLQREETNVTEQERDYKRFLYFLSNNVNIESYGLENLLLEMKLKEVAKALPMQKEELSFYTKLKLYEDLFFKQYSPQSTAFFLEEPELNLYPSAQYELMKRLITLINTHNHSLFITTHSPYILTTLNNLIYAGELGNMHKEEINQIIPEDQWLTMADVSAWKIENDSSIHSLIETEMKMIKAEEIDEISTTINKEFDKMFDLEMIDEDI